MSMGIYKIENLINGKVYIGQSIRIERRWKEHCFNSSDSLISAAIKKYGKENFSFEILEEVDDTEKLNQLESQYIQRFNSLTPHGYNVVIMDETDRSHQFFYYNQDTFFSIINSIKNTNKSFSEIAEEYGISVRTIYFLNRGDYHKLPNESYPLRPVLDLSKKQHFCVDCGCEIAKGSQRCSTCDHKRQRKVDRPSREELKQLIRITPFTKIGKKYGVADNTIRKWCKAYELPSKVTVIQQISDEDWVKI